jgi:hypothetical protein
VEAVAAVRTVETGLVPPTANFENPDPEIDLDVVAGSAREVGPGVVLSNSFAFGGHNVTLVFTPSWCSRGTEPATKGQMEMKRTAEVLGSRVTVAIGTAIVTAVVMSGVMSAFAQAAVEAGAEVVGANQVNSASIIDGAVRSIDIRDGAVASIDIRENSIAGGDILDGTISRDDIADGTITGGDILDGTVGSADIASNSLTAADLATDSVAAGEISANAVGTSEIAAGGVGASEIGFSAVGNGELAAIVQRDANVVVAAGADGNATANCLAGEQVISGGFIGGTSAINVRYARMSGNGWRAWGHNDGGTPVTLYVHAYCLAP